MRLFIKHKKNLLKQVSILLFCYPLCAYESLDFNFLKGSKKEVKNKEVFSYSDLLAQYSKMVDTLAPII